MSRAEFLDSPPIYFKAETRRLGQMHIAVPDLGATVEDRMVQRMAARIAVRLGAPRGITERRDKVRVQMPHRMRCDQDALLFGIVGNPQRLGEPRVPG